MVWLRQRRVLQDPACSHAALSAGEVLEALQSRHGDVAAAAAQVAANPFVTERSTQEKIKQAVRREVHHLSRPPLPS